MGSLKTKPAPVSQVFSGKKKGNLLTEAPSCTGAGASKELFQHHACCPWDQALHSPPTCHPEPYTHTNTHPPPIYTLHPLMSAICLVVTDKVSVDFSDRQSKRGGKLQNNETLLWSCFFFLLFSFFPPSPPPPPPLEKEKGVKFVTSELPPTFVVMVLMMESLWSWILCRQFDLLRLAPHTYRAPSTRCSLFEENPEKITAGKPYKTNDAVFAYVFFFTHLTFFCSPIAQKPFMLLMLLIYVPNSVPVFIYFYQSCNIKWKTHFSKDTLFAFHLMYATQIMNQGC